jgi:hypothetical protein
VKTTHAIVACLALPVLGCDPEPIEDDLRLSLGTDGEPVTVPIGCESPCDGDARLDVELEYVDDFRTDDETFELVQYRVDYDLPGTDGDVPYFAGDRGLTLAPGDTASFSVKIAGDAQRQFLLQELGEDAYGLEGRATLTLAGYDSLNAQVFIEGDFDVRFVDVAADAADVDSSAGTGDSAGDGGEDGGDDASQ